MSLYATGTIMGALNATTISGTGTKWSDAKIGITNGSVLFVSSNAGVDGVYQVKRVISDTSIELAQPIYKTFTNSKYSILVAESASTAAWSNQLAATLGYYQAQMDGWQQIMTGTGDIALTAPDGTKVTIKSFTKMSQDIDKKQDKSDILTDLSKSKDADGVREYLGLNESLNEKADSNDERFETIDGKTGGVIKSPITGFGIPGGTSVLAPWEASPYRVNDRFSPTYDSYMPTLSYGVGGNNGGWRSMISSGAVARQSAHPICIIASVGYDYDLNSRESREGHNLSYERSATGAPIMGSGRPDGSGYYSVTFNISSDERMKSDIKDLPNECALKKICALNYISFRFNECSGRNTKELRRGFSAQQAMIVDPQYVSVDRPSSLVNQSENIEVLRLDSNVLLLDALAAIKALNEKIEYLQSKLNEWKRE